MNCTSFKHLCLALAFSTGLGAIVCAPGAEAVKKFTITERIETLSSKVNAGQKSGELTLKEADSLRNKLSDVNNRIDKYKSKNGGKLSYANENTIEKDLNSVSLKLTKKELAKRTAKPNE
jgi:hypothetical protein